MFSQALPPPQLIDSPPTLTWVLKIDPLDLTGSQPIRPHRGALNTFTTFKMPLFKTSSFSTFTQRTSPKFPSIFFTNAPPKTPWLGPIPDFLVLMTLEVLAHSTGGSGSFFGTRTTGFSSPGWFQPGANPVFTPLLHLNHPFHVEQPRRPPARLNTGLRGACGFVFQPHR